jgi:hypothetical protein
MQLYIPYCPKFTQTTCFRESAAIDSMQGLNVVRLVCREAGHYAGLFDVVVYDYFFRAGLQLRRCLPEVEVAK